MSTSDIHANGVAAAQLHPTTTTPTTSNDPDVIREDIERTRENLAGTVDALHARLDVKSRAKVRVARVMDRATTASGKPRPEVVGAVGAALLVAGLLWRRRG